MIRPPKTPPWLNGTLILGAIAAAWALEKPDKSGRPTVGGRTMVSGYGVDPQSAALAHAQPRRGSPYVQPWSFWKRVLLNTYAQITDDRLLAVAAGVVFYALLAIFPAITAFVSLYGLFASPQAVSEHILLLSYVLPEGAVGIIQDQILRIASDANSGLSVTFFVGFAIALWSANAGVKALMDALNVVQNTSEKRSFVRLNAVSLSFTLAAIMFLLVAVGAVVAFPLIMSLFGLGEVVGAATWLVRWPVMLGGVMLALSVLYRFGPSGNTGKWRLISPGVVFAALAWLAGSGGLSFYLSSFADYNATYGSLGAAIGLMMWMWLTSIVVLLGAELDNEIDKLRDAPIVSTAT